VTLLTLMLAVAGEAFNIRLSSFSSLAMFGLLLWGYLTAYLGIGRLILLWLRRYLHYRLLLPVVIHALLLVAGAGGSELNRALGNGSGALPYTVLIDQDGRIVERHLGQVRPEQLRRWLDAALRRS